MYVQYFSNHNMHLSTLWLKNHSETNVLYILYNKNVSIPLHTCELTYSNSLLYVYVFIPVSDIHVCNHHVFLPFSASTELPSFGAVQLGEAFVRSTVTES